MLRIITSKSQGTTTWGVKCDYYCRGGEFSIQNDPKDRRVLVFIITTYTRISRTKIFLIWSRFDTVNETLQC